MILMNGGRQTPNGSAFTGIDQRRAAPVAMKKTSPSQANSEDVLKRSSLYQEFLAEREEILRHKWIESEKLGKDIGFERALLDWIRNHRDGWRASRRRSTEESRSGEFGTHRELAAGSIDQAKKKADC